MSDSSPSRPAGAGSSRKRPAVVGLAPPGVTTRIVARRVLVLAPHYDDEVLGCGGLLAELASGGARVRVVFLSDGGRRPDGSADGRPVEAAEDRSDYSARRREESVAALEALGIGGADGGGAAHLGLPDGALAAHLDDLAAAVEFEVGAFDPDLLLVPSPLEVTPDHRAAFAAVHRALGRLRPDLERGDDDPFAEAARELEVLAYEVNHPAYPDVLVDVSEHLPAIEAAMAAYASQQEIHDYLAAGLGLRRFRTLSLPGGDEGVAAAEGYRRLRPHDFATRSPADLIRRLGGVPELLEVTEGPRISVVVRTRDRPALLAEALASLAEGTYRRVEVVLVNDGGAPPEVPEGYPFPVRRVDLPENRGRAAAAQAGVEAATGDWLTFLDDDDLALPEHLAILASAAAGAGVRAVYSDAAVVTYELAGGGDPEPGEPGAPAGWTEAERRLPYSRDFDPDVLRLDNYIPFNTLLAERSLFEEVGFDHELPIFEDWDFLIRLARRTPFHHVRRVTCEYRHFRGAGHHALGERPRERADFLAVKAKVLAKHAGDLTPDALARAVDTLRAESVDQAEAARRARDEAAALRRAHDALADRYHRAHGEAAALREERGRLVAEVETSGEESRRLYQRERELAAHVDEQDAHLGRTYGEIERLNGIVETLRGATLPGIVRWWRENRRRDGE